MVTSDSSFDLRALRRDYGDARAEARSCRSAAALFDFSFMRRLVVRGSGAQALVQTLTPRPMHDLAPGRIRYALRLDTAGNVLSDITIWRHDTETFEVFGGRPDEFAHLQASTGSAVSVCDVSGETAIFAVQGPLSLRALAGVALIAALKTLPYFAHAPASIGGVKCRIGRLGYTGERGFEIILPKRAREAVWALLAEHARPAGFAAADVLRIEAGFLLFSNEFLFPVSPSELGLGRFAATPECGQAFPPRMSPIRLVSFQAQCDHEPILWQPLKDAVFPPPLGTLLVTSACRSIVSGEILGLGYACRAQGVPHLVDPSGHFREIREVVVPFHDTRKRRPRGGWDDDLLPAGADSFI
jgi:glycine cleavage system aminomethyltransferase T